MVTPASFSFESLSSTTPEMDDWVEGAFVFGPFLAAKLNVPKMDVRIKTINSDFFFMVFNFQQS
jgi:hypothetical protein